MNEARAILSKSFGQSIVKVQVAKVSGLNAVLNKSEQTFGCIGDVNKKTLARSTKLKPILINPSLPRKCKLVNK